MSDFRALKACRSCGASGLHPILSFGDTPLANALVTPGETRQIDAMYPLDLVYCRACTLVQITEEVPPEVLFRDYVYLSSFSDTTVANARTIAHRLIDQRRLSADSLVVEIASNDGYLLQHYRDRGVPVLGIDPARNIAEVARRKGIETLDEFFTREFAQRLVDEGRKADIIHANNVMAHVPDTNGFVQGIATLLREDGVAVIEVPYVIEMIDRLEFDTIYHEHLCYFSLTSVDALFTRNGLRVVDVERLPIHGGSLRIFGALSGRPSDAVTRMLADERAWGVASVAAYDDFSRRVDALSESLRELLGKLKSEGKTIAAYGASAKGTTLLSYTHIGGETIDFVADRSTVKHGKLTPGTHIEIVPAEELLTRMPDYVLMLVWNFAEEILKQQQAYRGRGGKFIIPLPEVTIV
jgi:2-polyprenyl-3-methyl-5-hydroxy-6-metoxy-1,4-benzoquinol methylase